ncbi:PIN domain-containing protein [Sphingomonas koreensis]
MTRYLLDTNILSDLVRHPQGKIADRIGEIGEGAVCTSIIVAAELRFGAAKSGSKRLTLQVEAILDAIEILPLLEPVDQEYARVRSELERAGTPIGGNDLLIAAHARALGLSVVTDNVRDFECVAGLTVENWLRDPDV